MRPWPFGLLIALVTGIADQLSKWLLLDIIDAAGGFIPVTGFFNLVMVWNPGVSFGMFQSLEAGRWIFIGLAGIVSIIFLVWLKRAHSRWLAAALGLVIGGAIGNSLDRLWFGAVFDFLDFHLSGLHWPAFNVADCAIVVGFLMLLLESFWSKAPAQAKD